MFNGVIMSRGLYIHVPFCIRKCPYCDFYSVTDVSLTAKYTDAVIRNIKAQNVYADTVYFGGGTPSLLTAKQLYDIISAADIAADAEITMECNPNSVTPQYLAEIKDVGINRVSFGVQSLDNGELKALGRLHNAEEAEKAIISAYDVGIENISADIMLGTAFQTPVSLHNTIERLKVLPLKHISAYMLKIEPDTSYGKDNALTGLLPDEDETADLYLQAVRELEDAGFMQYEISNFARRGYESKHNLKYWRCEEYYGIGPAAHSYVDGVRKACPRDIAAFIRSEVQREDVMGTGGDMEERIMLALRLTQEGIDLNDLPQKSSDNIQKCIKQLISAGIMKQEGSRVMLTAQGCLVSNEIIYRIIEAV